MDEKCQAAGVHACPCPVMKMCPMLRRKRELSTRQRTAAVGVQPSSSFPCDGMGTDSLRLPVMLDLDDLFCGQRASSIGHRPGFKEPGHDSLLVEALVSSINLSP